MAKSKGGAIESKLRDYALGFPEAYEEFPWGHSAIKVKTPILTWSVAIPSGSPVAPRGRCNKAPFVRYHRRPCVYAQG
jgi:hypothetical protein